MALNKQYYQLLYLDKLQTAFLYENAARKLKGYSEAAYDRFAEFSQQDICHATGLHGLLVEMDLSEPGDVDVALSVDRVQGIGLKANEGDGEDPDLFISMCKDWSQTFIRLEKRIENLISEMNKNEPELIEFSSHAIDMLKMMTISSERIIMLTDFIKRVQADQIFKRKNENQKWRCTSCGYIDECPEAPEECSCCHALLSAQVAGDWKIP